MEGEGKEEEQVGSAVLAPAEEHHTEVCVLWGHETNSIYECQTCTRDKNTKDKKHK